MKNDSLNLSKNEMIMVLHDQEREIEKLKERITDLEAELNCREIKLSEAGSLADAAARISGLFEAADDTARTYVETLKDRSEKTEKILGEVQERAENIIKEAEEVASKRIEMVDGEIDQKWSVFYEKLAILCASNEELKGVVEAMGIKLPED